MLRRAGAMLPPAAGLALTIKDDFGLFVLEENFLLTGKGDRPAPVEPFEIASEHAQDGARIASQALALPASDSLSPVGVVARYAVVLAALHHAIDALLAGEDGVGEGHRPYSAGMKRSQSIVGRT